jgi:deoxyribodipyrimidine photolyase
MRGMSADAAPAMVWFRQGLRLADDPTLAAVDGLRVLPAFALDDTAACRWSPGGAAWFRDTLVDADPVNDSSSRRWAASAGTNAAPCSRIFDPVLLGEEFDPAGTYLRRVVPKLAGLSDRWLHRLREAPVAGLRAAGVALGRDCPRPVLELAAFARLRRRAAAAAERVV